MAEVERSWFRRVLDGQDVPLVWSPDGDFQVAYDAADAAPEEAFAAWQAEIAIARDIEAAAPSLDVTGVDRRSGDEYSLRRILHHLIQEYARHNGHADLIREGIDGADGRLTVREAAPVDALTAVEARTLLASAFVEDPLMRVVLPGRRDAPARLRRTLRPVRRAVPRRPAASTSSVAAGRWPWRCGGGPARPADQPESLPTCRG